MSQVAAKHARISGLKAGAGAGCAPSVTEFAIALPHAAAVFADHRLSGLARERTLELGHVHHQAVDAVLAGRVRVGQGPRAQILRAMVLAGPLRISHEETLLGREAVPPLRLGVD